MKKLNLESQMRPCGKHVIFGNGVRDAVQGSLCLNVSIEGQDLQVNALVIRGKGPNLILGFDFLYEHDLLVDCKERCLKPRHAMGGIACHTTQQRSRSITRQLLEDLACMTKKVLKTVTQSPKQKN